MADSMFSIMGLTRLLRGKWRKRTSPPAPPQTQRAAQDTQATQATLDSLRAQLKDAEALAADALAKTIDLKAHARQQEEAAQQQLAKLSRTSEALTQELQQTKEALQQAQAQSPPSTSHIFLSALVDSARDAVCVLDQAGTLLSWNRAAETIFGYTRPEALSLGVALLIAQESRASFLKSIEGLGNERTRTLDIQGARKDGSVFPAEVILACWQEGEQKQYVLIAHDASERRHAEAMRRDKEAAEEANRAKSQFLANMSHELRTPLNAIIGFSEILHDRTFGELTPKQERYVGNILSSGRHLLQLINDILDLSKIEAGRIQLEYASFSPLTAARTVDNLVKALLQKKNISLEIEAETSLPPLIADQAKFKQVLYNLISNAIKFTPEGGKVLVSLCVKAKGFLQVSVKDNGIGIKQEDQARIFQEFEQVDSSYSRQQQGTGLGLALVRKFIELHGGTVWVESAGEGQGSTFCFTLPFSPTSEPPGGGDRGTKPPRLAVAENTPTGGIKSVALVAGNDLAAVEALTSQLQERHYDVVRATHPEEIVGLVQELKPALICLDLESLASSGWVVLRSLQSDAALQSTPVLALVVEREREEAHASGAACALTKPLGRPELQAALTALQAAPVRPQRGRSARVAA